MRAGLLLISLFMSSVVAGCSTAPSAPAAQSTNDARVQKRAGQAPPELTGDVRWLNAPPTTLAALRGRAVFVQFAFPT